MAVTKEEEEEGKKNVGYILELSIHKACQPDTE
jgi:hypothetical protein